MLEARWASRGVLLGARLTTRIRQARPLATISVRERIVCGALLLGAAIINLFQLARSGYGNTYYAAAVRSMLESWHNFFFVSFDPGGFVTIDKPPVDFWLQALSAKLFGLNGFSLALPQALAGIASVAVLYVLVRRIFGMLPAALAALALALSPVNVATNRDNIVDSMLALVILLAAWAAFKAVETGRMRWLLGCAALVGLGFNIKMLEAYLVVPAFAALYLLAAPHPWRRRVGRLALAGVLLLVVSLSWATVVDLTPASQRPYVGSSSTNSELNLAFGYNGIERLAGRLFGGGGSAGGGGGQGASPARPATGTGESDFPRISAATSTRPTRATPPQGGGFGAFGTGGPGPLRLFNTALGTQVSWLLPLALLGLLASCWQVRPRQLVATWRERWRAEWAEEPAGRATPQVALAVGTRLWSALRLTSPQQSWVLWGMWLLTMGVFFSVASFFHSYYMVMMTPAICALAGIGLVGLWRDYRQAGWRGWLLPIALVVTAGVQLHLLAGAPTNWGWLGPMIAIAALATAGCLCVLRLAADTAAGERLVAWLPSNSPLQRMGTAWLQVTPRLRGWAGRAGIITAVGVVGLLLAPAAWSAATVTSPGNEMTPSAGPRTMAFGGGGFGGGGFGGGGFDVGASTDSRLITYLTAHQGKATYLLATQNAMSAAPYILRTGKPVMALGGFSGSDPILTTAGLREMISRGEVRYFLLASGRGFSLSPASLDELPPQVRDFLEGGAFARGGRGQRGSGGLGGFGGFGANASLTSWVTGHCAVVPTSQWRSTASTPASSGAGTPGGLGGFARGGGAGEALYDCATTH